MTSRTRPAWCACVLTATTLLLAGCGTFRNLTEEGALRPYGGVSTDMDEVCDNYERAPNAVISIVGLLGAAVDTPFSAIGDTLTLPYVIPASQGWLGNRPNVPVTPILRPSLDDPPSKW